MVYLAAAIGFFERFWHQILIIALSCVPLIESRYAIVLGIGLFPELTVVELFILTQLGACLTGLVILLLLRTVFNWMKTTKVFRHLVEKLEEHGLKKGKSLEEKMNSSKNEKARAWASAIGVFLFVAIPLPGTGVWTGCLVATLLNIRFKYAFPAVCLGSIVATLIMLAFSSVFFPGVQLW
ncbi:MAG: small multi-drug export protein [Clostridia bacterium]|nr:small multi-drug export protein [Clostridia bacterium]